MAITKFSPPAFINDLTPELEQKWSIIVQNWFQDAINYLKNPDGFNIKKPFLFSLLDHPEAESGPNTEIPWNGYPRKYKLAILDNNQRWRLTESIVNSDLDGRQLPYFYNVNGGIRASDIYFRDQDEYCEWKTFYNEKSNQPEKIIFTCENPEYWKFISEENPDLLLSKYRELTQGNVQMKDLFFDKEIYYPNEETGENENQFGKYNPHNKWNTSQGIIHLTHPANSLSAEVYLAADATILRKNSNGQFITDDKDLICCANYGGVNRSSDPTIGSRINALVRNQYSITINDPVGLYIHSLDSAAFEFPDGIFIEDCWKVVRGKDNMILRAEFSMPERTNYNLGDIKIGGVPLQYGGQIAEYINMVIFGKGFDFQQGVAEDLPCTHHCCAKPNFPNMLVIKEINIPCTPPLESLVLSTPWELMGYKASKSEFFKAEELSISKIRKRN